MRAKQFTILFTTLLMLSVLSLQAHAQLLALKFNTPEGESRSVAPTRKYINPQGTLGVLMSGGLERRLRATLLSVDGEVVETKTSPVVGAGDTFVEAGKEYYGFQVDLQAPEEGSYTLRAEIIDGAGRSVAMEEYPVQIDVTPPTAGVMDWYYKNKWVTDETGWLMGRHSQYMFVRDTLDEGSGIEEVRLATYYPPGDAQEGEKNIEIIGYYDEAKQQATSGNKYAHRAIFKPYRHAWDVRFDIVDKAGNKTTVRQEVRYNGTCGTRPVAVALYDPTYEGMYQNKDEFKGWREYRSGMAIQENPFKMLWRLPKDNDVSQTQYGFYNFNHDYEDENYYYEVVESTYSEGSNTWTKLWRTRTSGCTWSSYNVVPADGVEYAKAPILQEFHIIHDDGTVVTGTKNLFPFVIEPFHIKRFEVVMEPRNYEQEIEFSSRLGTCRVPPGETTCSVAWELNVTEPGGGGYQNSSYPVGTGYWPVRAYAFNPDRTMKTTLPYYGPRWDLNAPQSLGMEILDDKVTAKLYVYDPDTNTHWNWSWWQPVWGELKLVEKSGLTHTVRHKKIEHPDTNDYYFYFDISSIPDGQYTVYATVRDRMGNQEEQLVAERVNIDNQPPEAIILSGAVLLDGSTVTKLDDISVALVDAMDLNPELLGIRISGGPSQMDINLAWHTDSTGRYRLEYPAMFPSTEEGDYVLTVVAKDHSHNVGETEAHFSLRPPIVTSVYGDTVLIPAITRAFKAQGDSWAFTSNPLLTAEGTPIAGRQSVQVFLRADSTGPFEVAGQRINPGESITIDDYDFSGSQGRISLPVSIVEEGTRPTGNLMVVTNYPGAPIFSADIETWLAGDEIFLKPDPLDFAVAVEQVRIDVKAKNPGPCKGKVMEEGVANASNAACAIRWVNIPEGLMEQRVSGQPLLVGRLDSTGEYTVSYQPGILENSVDGNVFHPMGEVVSETISIELPQPPAIDFVPSGTNRTKSQWVADGEWPASVGEDRQNGYIVATGQYPRIVLEVTDSDGNTEILQSPSKQAKKLLITSLTGIGDREAFHVKAYHPDFPDIFSEADVVLSAVPDHAQVKLARPGPLNTEVVADITGNLGEYDRIEEHFVFDPIRMGNWRVQLYEVSRTTGDEWPIGSAVDITESDGAFSIRAGKLSPGYHYLKAKASLTIDGQTRPDAIESAVLSLFVHDGSAIDGKVTARTEAGRTPFVVMPRILLDEPSRARDVGKVIWETSSDGSNWKTIDTGRDRSFALYEKITETGKRWYRARLFNVYSGVQTQLEPLMIQAYEVPNVAIDGYQQTFIGHPVTWTARTTDGKPATFRWEVRANDLRSDPVLVKSGNSIELPTETSGRYYIMLTAKPVDAEEISGSERKLVKTFQVQAPNMRPPAVVGPNYVEVGKTYRFIAYNRPVIESGGTDLVVKGEWETPNGMIYPGETIDYTFQEGDEKLVYRAWVEGYRDITEIEVEKKLYVWTYEWPTSWVLSTRQTRFEAPLRLMLNVSTDPLGDIKKMGLEKPVYDYTVPEGAEVYFAGGNRLVVDIQKPGTYPIEALISDSRGNQEVATITVEVTDPPPLTAYLTLYGMDRWSRAPSQVMPRVGLKNMVSGEKIELNRVLIDGKQVWQGPSLVPPESFVVSTVGTHEIRSEVTLDSGRSAVASEQFTLVQGDLPECSLRFTQYDLYMQANLSCLVRMGLIRKIEWYASFDDTGEEELLGVSGYWATFGDSAKERGISAIRIVVTNDLGQKTQIVEAYPKD